MDCTPLGCPPVGFSRQEHWSGLPFPSPGNLPNRVVKPASLTSTGLAAAAAAPKSLQSCLILCDPIDSSPLGSPIPGSLQARTLEWVDMSFSDASKWKVKVKLGKWSCSVVSDSQRPHGPQSTRLLRPWGFPGKSTGVGCHRLLQPDWQAGSLPVAPPGKPKAHIY